MFVHGANMQYKYLPIPNFCFYLFICVCINLTICYEFLLFTNKIFVYTDYIDEMQHTFLKHL